MKTISKVALATIFLSLSFNSVSQSKISDEEIKQLLINQSVGAYSGNCPCPYNRASNGSRCGKRSAYSKPGGYEPLCYKEDVTPEMIKRYKGKLKNK